MLTWHSIATKKPKHGGLCVVYAPSCDKDSPLVMVSKYRRKEKFYYLVETWNTAITHWGYVNLPK